MKNLLALIGWVALCFAAAGIGAVASANAPEFYNKLTLPSFAPPAWVFGPVWTVLYLLMAIAAWLVWREREHPLRRTAMGVFLAQLVVNALWSWLFFTWQMGAASFADIMLLWCFIAETLLVFWRVKPLAGMLIVPYFGWVSFAAVLNFAIWRANPQILG